MAAAARRKKRGVLAVLARFFRRAPKWALALAAVALTWWLRRGRIPAVYYLKTRRNHHLISRMDSLQRGYIPPLLVRNTHAVTGWVCSQIGLVDILGIPAWPQLDIKRQFFYCKGGKTRGKLPGWITLNWMYTAKNQLKGTVVLIPGMGNDVFTPYIRKAAKELLENGFNVVIFEPRGSPTNLPRLTTAQTQSAGATGDLRQAFDHICEKTRASYGDLHKIFGIGWSLGSSYLVKYAGEEGDNCLLSGIIGAGCPLDLASTSQRHSKTLWGLYQFTIIEGMKMKLKDDDFKRAQDVYRRAGYDVDKLLTVKSILELDSRFTRRQFDYDTVAEYYRDSSATNYLSKVRVPCLLVNARDDAMVDTDAFFVGDFMSNPNLIGVKTTHGGHSLEWPEGYILPNGTSWFSGIAKEFLNGVLEYTPDPAFSKKLRDRGLKFSPKISGISGRIRLTSAKAKL